MKTGEVIFGPDHLNVAHTLYNLAAVNCLMGRYSKGELLFQRCLKIRETKLGPDHPDVADTLDGLGNVYSERGQYAKAEPFYRRSLKIMKARFGPDHLSVANCLHNLGMLYTDLGQYAKAKPILESSLKIKEAKLGEDHPDIANSLNGMGNVYFRLGQYSQAEPLYQRGLKIHEAKLGPDHPSVANSLNNLANVYKALGIFAKAEPLHQRSLKIREAKLGGEHPLVAISLNNLAGLYCDMGQYPKAEPLLQRSLKVREATLGANHPNIALALKNLALLLYQNLDRPKDAVPLVDRMRRIDRRHAARTLPMFTEPEQLAFLQTTDEDHREFALSVALEGKVPGLTDLSAAWVLNGKAVAHQTLAERALLSRDANNSQAAPLVAALTTVRRQLTTLVMASYDKEKQAQRQKEIARLNRRERELSRQLGQAVGRPVRDDPWIELAEVRAAIPNDGILIEIARFDVCNFKAKGKENQSKGLHYVAWLIPAAGHDPVQLIDLGEADRIDSATSALRKELRLCQNPKQEINPILRLGEPDAEKRLRPALEAVTKLVLKPLRKHLDGKKQWIFSPDGRTVVGAVGCAAFERRHLRH